MVPLKCFLSIVLQLIIIEPFINAKALERTVGDTAFCPISRETGGSTWLLHGIHQKCYVAGSQGPCAVNQVFIPQSKNSKHGQCISISHASIPKLTSGDRHQDITQKLVSYNRIKREIKYHIFWHVVPPYNPNPSQTQTEVCLGCQIPTQQPYKWCPNGTVWSTHRRRCIQRNRPFFIG